MGGLLWNPSSNCNGGRFVGAEIVEMKVMFNIEDMTMTMAAYSP